jgi:hypothetical protein
VSERERERERQRERERGRERDRQRERKRERERDVVTYLLTPIGLIFLSTLTRMMMVMMMLMVIQHITTPNNHLLHNLHNPRVIERLTHECIQETCDEQRTGRKLWRELVIDTGRERVDRDLGV